MRVFKFMPVIGGTIVSLTCATIVLIEPVFVTPLREAFFDYLTQRITAPRSHEIIVVDVDRATIQHQSRIWNRSSFARLVARISDARPKAIASDIVFSSSCDSNEVSNQALQQAIARTPTILGFLVGDATDPPKPVPSVAVQQPIHLPSVWFIDGAEASCMAFQHGARSAAAAFLIGDADAHVRKVQAFAILSSSLYPTLGLEAARLAAGGKTPMLALDPIRVRIGETLLRLDANGSFRFAASSIDAIAQRTVSAGDVLAETVSGEVFANKLVFIGSSMPQLGGLRPTASTPIEPSIQIHADVANALLTGFMPNRPAGMPVAEAIVSMCAGFFLVLLAAQSRLSISAALAVLFVSGAMVGAIAAYALAGLLFDAVAVSSSLIIAIAFTIGLRFAVLRKAEAAARSKLSQYFPKSIVDQFIENPGTAVGQERLVTALFTDIEGFCALTQRLKPQELVLLLNDYFTEVNATVATYGGMVDKVVGDSVHALFNAPDNLVDHVDKALECAEAISALTEEMRRRPLFAQHRFGRTRIGIETGTVVIGEVGAGDKLDYTAHGSAMNLAARLQEANKFLDTSICVGPDAAMQCRRPLCGLGIHAIRGFGTMELFTTRPPTTIHP